uniref:Uncharacterized protein n=1 Tax=Medicago truncatula TaxID=3880 RepID=Q2HS61_MEDTR|nr:hypothetical protein MtrDRAFT_AC157373g9v2 [Medicago truncatula]
MSLEQILSKYGLSSKALDRRECPWTVEYISWTVEHNRL